MRGLLWLLLLLLLLLHQVLLLLQRLLMPLLCVLPLLWARTTHRVWLRLPFHTPCYVCCPPRQLHAQLPIGPAAQPPSQLPATVGINGHVSVRAK